MRPCGGAVSISSPNKDCDGAHSARMAKDRPVSRKPVTIASDGRCDSCGDDAIDRGTGTLVTSSKAGVYTDRSCWANRIAGGSLYANNAVAFDLETLRKSANGTSNRVPLAAGVSVDAPARVRHSRTRSFSQLFDTELEALYRCHKRAWPLWFPIDRLPR